MDHPTLDAQLLIQHISYTYSLAFPAYRCIKKDPLHTALRNSYDIVLLGGRRQETVPAPVASAMKQHVCSNRDGDPATEEVDYYKMFRMNVLLVYTLSNVSDHLFESYRYPNCRDESSCY